MPISMDGKPLTARVYGDVKIEERADVKHRFGVPEKSESSSNDLTE